jgi:hypothetical protein
MLDILQPARSKNPGAGYTDSQWTFNLNVLPQVQSYLDIGAGRRRGVFAKVRDPRVIDAEREIWKRSNPDAHPLGGESNRNYLPLWVFFTSQEEYFREAISRIDQRREGAQAGKAAPDELLGALLGLRSQILAILKREVPLVRYSNEASFEDMLRIYVRINSTGRQAQEEECAFANIQGLDPSAHRRVRDLFILVHGDGSEDSTDERLFLRRAREEQLGFKFFLRMFVHACAYHLDLPKEYFNPSLGFLSKEQDEIQQEALKQLSPALWRRVAELVRYFKNAILEKVLRCDDTRHVSATAPLAPLFHLLLMYPVLLEDRHHSRIAAMVLKILLLDPPQATREDLLVKLAKAKCLSEALDCFDEACKNWDQEIPKKIQGATGIQHRGVKLLYWLLRSRGARDFSYEVNPVVKVKMPGGGVRSVEVEKQWNPEVQHIVPFTNLQDSPELKAKRSRRGLPNAIGNLTYISQKMNSLPQHGGLGPRMFTVSGEQKENPNNLIAHLVMEESGKPAIPDLLMALKDQCDGKKPLVSTTYEKFVLLRGREIGMAFTRWIQKLEAQPSVGDVARAIEDRSLQPEPRMIDDWALRRFVEDRISAWLAPTGLAEEVLAALRALRLHRIRRSFDGKKREAVLSARIYSSIELQLRQNCRLTLTCKDGFDLLPAAAHFGGSDKLSLPMSEWVSLVRKIAAALNTSSNPTAAPASPMTGVFHPIQPAGSADACRRLTLVLEDPRLKALEQSASAEPKPTQEEFEIDWEKRHGKHETTSLHQFCDVLRSSNLPGIRVQLATHGRPLIRVRWTKGYVVTALRPRLRDGTIAEVLSENLHTWKEPVAGALKDLQAAMGSLPGAKTYGTFGNVEVPVSVAAEHAVNIVEFIRDFISKVSRCAPGSS